MFNRNFEAVTPDDVLLDELVAVLAPAPAGLRRWSVMRAIRKNRQANGRDIPLKMEADIERTFRRYCAADGARPSHRPASAAPRKPARIWALNPAWTPEMPA